MLHSNCQTKELSCEHIVTNDELYAKFIIDVRSLEITTTILLSIYVKRYNV
jgi:hypothetical protein